MLQYMFDMLAACSREFYDIDNKRYYVREMIGQGVSGSFFSGFSTVHLVSEAGTDRVFAMKKIRCHNEEDEQNALNEVNYYKQLRHPAVIECVASTVIGTADINTNQTSLVLLLFPYFLYGSLEGLLKNRQYSRNYLNQKAIMNYFQQICEGLAVIHDSGFSHRDLKPGNILLAHNDKIIIMDLGSAAPARVEINSYSAAQRLQEDAAQRCSITYRAPELFNVLSPSSIDERTDIWSLGCLLYALCFFKSPFDEVHEHGDSVAMAASSGTVKYPQHSEYNPLLIDLISKMLVVDPKQRPFISDVLQSVESIQKMLADDKPI